ncbi:carboxypeptidase-like regulatory domain-containing protein [Dokdonia sinensis]|uniref:Carboxypeptidase-like regulatory domain-containing protein n=1 Tax=Dokdonia sinensis TaxID=2479847 RepID=A0A3M0GGU8_9FLAO|nr:carboxypeptidase-like regulatory domain-containing protein [Dokdonia sinensis]RMB63498.1 carboxypeptidase-like regulatory domain-containing protein [Dokdonia sinensis]
MTTLIKYLVATILVLGSAFLPAGQAGAKAQSYSATVLDAKTGEPIPFATIQLSKNRGTVTNGEGIFSIDMEDVAKLRDSVFISSMGYEEVSIYPKKATDTIIRLAEKLNELEIVFLTDNPLEPNEIVERIKENLASNYPNNYTQKKLFFRQSLYNKMNRADVDFKKSTIEELNEALIDSIVMQIPKESSYYSESIGTLSGNYNKQKLFVDKSAKLYDKSKDVSFDGFGKRLEKIFKENVKPDSYLKIKSGWFGTKVELDEVETKEAPDGDDGGVQVRVGEDPTTQDITSGVKDDINELYEQLFFQEDTKLDFLQKSNRYEFTQTGITSIGENLVYILDFEPKGGKDFSGTMYVNTDDFAIVRLDFQNVKKLYGIKLLGIGYRDILYKGTSLFAKDESSGYSLKYMELERGIEFTLDRPLTVIEKNKNVKGRRKQNELDLNLDFKTTAVTKSEFVVFDSKDLSESDYGIAKESTGVEATYLSAYDPAFWEGYTIMEPNATIQAFKVVE